MILHFHERVFYRLAHFMSEFSAVCHISWARWRGMPAASPPVIHQSSADCPSVDAGNMPAL